MKKQIALIIFVLFTSTTQVFASNNTGNVGMVLVGRLGNQVEFQVFSSTNNDCSTVNSSGFKYAFTMDGTPGAKEILSALLTAYATQKQIIVQGLGTCGNVDNSLEDVGYIILKP